MVGREHELDWLRGKYDEARAGLRRVIFVGGEPGIGKTTFVRAFLDPLAGDAHVRIGRGQCVEQYGAGEPYMPILEALTRLAQQPGGGQIIEILNQMAPSWLAQMPSLLNDSERERVQSAAQGVTQPRMLREMGSALDAITAETPLVVLLEDLHWSDFSTFDLIAAIARRTEPARLLIVGTYRPAEILASHHPLRALKAELELHRYARSYGSSS
jgi:predicted ATPase